VSAPYFGTMKKLMLAAAFVLAACGPVMGDPCTVNTECGPGVCLNQAFAPGGMCSLTCTPGGKTCPSGSTCVSGVIASDTPGCLKSCSKDADCRSGYVCRTEHDSLTKVCIGTAGL
jgi:hypothetical protein